ncbi:MAG: glutamyl-tRNA reductase [Pirellulaceae bacterium]|jgi:glutamyl-tRNA reductase|nr:glutamyl-tRNA reductase [Pirellulaceae bacterium]
MKLHLVGCSHRSASLDMRERLVFTPDQTTAALAAFRATYPAVEAVLLSTCNRIELYIATQDAAGCPTHAELIRFLAAFHGLDDRDVSGHMYQLADIDAVRHLFLVAASLDSMVVGEPQILSQVKQAFAVALEQQVTGPVTHLAFEAANRVAKRVATETEISRRRVSIPSIAVGDFAKQLFETFHDKRALLLGAGEMGEETLRYLRDEGAQQIVVLTRQNERAEVLAQRLSAAADAWEHLDARLAWADLVISVTSSREPIVTAARFQSIHRQRSERVLFVLDLAVPRDFDPAIAQFGNVYLYSLDDLQLACERNRRAREQEWPKAQRIVEEEASRFAADIQHRVTGRTIQRLKHHADALQREELRRLFNKLGPLDARTREEIERSFERLVNKFLHPPLESLRDEASRGSPQRLLDALRHLFQIDD